MVRFNPKRHVRYQGELEGFLNRRFSREDLFIVRSRLTGMWSVCVWENEGGGWFRELYGFRGPGHFTKDDVAKIELILRPDDRTPAQKRQEALSQARDEKRQMEDEIGEASEAKRFLKRKLGIDNPFMDIPGGFPIAI